MCSTALWPTNTLCFLPSVGSDALQPQFCVLFCIYYLKITTHKDNSTYIINLWKNTSNLNALVWTKNLYFQCKIPLGIFHVCFHLCDTCFSLGWHRPVLSRPFPHILLLTSLAYFKFRQWRNKAIIYLSLRWSKVKESGTSPTKFH